jgi:hypothetical protein
MTLALFDLDHTLLEGDSDQLWGDFLLKKGWISADYQDRKNAFFADIKPAGWISMPSLDWY